MDILVKVLGVVAPVFFLAGCGYVWVRMRLGYDLAFVSRLAMTLGMPCLIFTALARAEVDHAALRDLAVAALVGYAAVAVLSYGLCRLFGLDIRAMLSPIIFGNTGNIGLPVILFAYGETGLAYALVVFAVMIILNFSLGVWLVSGEGSREMLRQPMVYGAVLGGLALYFDYDPPAWAMNTLTLLGQISIPLMLITLGVAIARLSARDVGLALGVSVLKLAIGTAVSVALITAFGLGWGAAGGAFLLQMTMPVAVSSYLLAARYNTQPDSVAGMVVVSTLLSVAAIPSMLAFLL
ncbi:AEC family transporter [Paroceanicella profunda]|uniref:AEC family transporter n=1 Tax=Paroceanicella profunda TaxID=2579971 RepID=A0A5B8FWD5_9RHOB|nr:AEC family transporter [Paroceanicella profunda]QDL90809.1 AEC family transporter [Paroceanicella profunda]